MLFYIFYFTFWRSFIIIVNLFLPACSVTSSDQERSCILLLRLQAAGGAWRWVHCVLQLKDAMETSTTSSSTSASSSSTSSSATPPAQTTAQTPAVGAQNGTAGQTTSTTTPASTVTQPTQQQQPIIVATNQVLSEREAAVLRSNSWLYHYYTMQSKLQYGLAYEAQRVHAYYPQVMPYQVSRPRQLIIPIIMSCLCSLYFSRASYKIIFSQVILFKWYHLLLKRSNFLRMLFFSPAGWI